MDIQTIVVPDASIILKWGFDSPDEPDRDKALEILYSWLDGKIEIILPKLWAFEVGNILALRNPTFAEEIMDIFIGYRFAEYETTAKLCGETFKLIKKYRVTFYDGVYHAVALLNKGTLFTADKAYYSKALQVGSVSLLKDFSI